MLHKQLIKYGITGVVATAIHIGIASLFIRFINESLLFSNSVGFLFAFIWSYYAQSKFVFKSSVSSKKGAKFFLVQVVSLILSVNLADLAEGVSIYLKVFIVAFLLPICAFVIHKLWTFVEHDEKG